MKKLLSLAAVLGLVCSAGLAQAASGDLSSQQLKMAACNQQAAGKKGDDRKAFMKTCLSAQSTASAAAPATQQEKMKLCNQQAAGKKGDDRKAFMKTCLSK